MPRKPCYWTRSLELDLVEFIRTRDFIWRPCGNTNHQIQKKYRAYAEFAAKLGHGFTARSVRDRWVNIRSTFNHNLRRVEKSKETAKTPDDIYVPCWPLWKPLQFLRDTSKLIDPNEENYQNADTNDDTRDIKMEVKDESVPEINTQLFPRHGLISYTDDEISNADCQRLLDDLVNTMKPLVNGYEEETKEHSYWFFGRHVTERLNCMREYDAECASREIISLLDNWSEEVSLEQQIDAH